jgi:predicted RecA/RadA family phage recombinase
MAKEATFIQSGNVIDYTAAANIAYGAVVPLVTCVGVALEDIASGATGSVTITGVFEAAAVNTAAFAVGDKLYWDDAANKLTKTDTSNTPAGICVAIKESAGTTARVKIG